MTGSSLLYSTFQPRPTEPLAYRNGTPNPTPRRPSADARAATTVTTTPAPVATSTAPAAPFVPSPAPNPTAPPVPHARAPTAASSSTGAPLRVHGVDLPRIDLADLRPGDIGFVYQRKKLNRRQRLIGLGERMVNLFRPWRRGSPHVLHAFIVVDTHPASQKILVADAAAGDKMDNIVLLVMDFQKDESLSVMPRWPGTLPMESARPAAGYLFYRAQDNALAQRIAMVARNWTYTRGANNFSAGNAVKSTFHAAALHRHARKRALYMGAQADHKGPLMREDRPKATYNMMCSEFVTNVCIAATLSQWQQARHAAGEKADLNLTGLWSGPAGDTFALDAKGAPPSVLQARLARSKAIRTVGYIPGDEAFIGTTPSSGTHGVAWAGSGR